MANLNRVMLIGRLTRDPEVRAFGNGGKVAHFGFAVNNKKKNQQTGQWEDEPVFLDIEAFNRETGRKLADLVEQYFRKGAQFYLEGHLKLDQWQDKTDGTKRSKIKIVLEDFQFFEARQDGMNNEGGSAPRAASRPSSPPAAGRRPAPAAPASNGNYDEPEPDYASEPPQSGDGGDIPF
jgi:single-strand DNA-binding protein